MATGAAAQKQLDPESRTLLYEGASVSQLAKLFGMDNRSVAEKIAGISPCGERVGFPIYRIADAATRLAPLDEREVERRIQNMNPADLPKMLGKEFWAGMRARREYEHQAGALWTTEEVQTAATAAFKALRTALLLFPDRVAAVLGLKEGDREKVQREVDTIMENLRARLDIPDRRSAVPRMLEPEDGEI